MHDWGKLVMKTNIFCYEETPRIKMISEVLECRPDYNALTNCHRPNYNTLTNCHRPDYNVVRTPVTCVIM